MSNIYAIFALSLGKYSAILYISTMGRKRKAIKIVNGKKPELARICGVSLRTVYSALHWENDTPAQALVRKRAYELGFVKKF